MASSSKRVLVIGAGIAGLTAAFRLKQAGVSVRVLESAALAGGRVRSIHRNGYIMDVGADAITTGYHEYLSVLRECGLESQLVPTPSVIGTIRAGRVVHMNTASLWSMATNPLLSLGAKLQLYRGWKKAGAIAGDVHLADLHRLGALDDDARSTVMLTEATFGPEASHYLIDPMLRTLGGTGLAGSSWVDVVAGMALASQSSYCLRGGLAVLPLHLAKQLDVAYETRVRNITEQNDQVSVTYEDKEGHLVTDEVDGCILATTYESAIEIYPPFMEISTEYRQHLSSIRVGKIHLGYSTRTASPAYVVQVPTVEDPDVMLVFLDHNKCEDRAPAGHSLVTVYFETTAADRLMHRSDAELTDWARGKAEKWFPELRAHFDQSHVTRWPVMAPAATRGYYARAADVLARLSPAARVQIACDMFSKTSQEAAATWGARAARNLIGFFDLPQDAPRAA